jgi:hypothetical protein
MTSFGIGQLRYARMLKSSDATHNGSGENVQWWRLRLTAAASFVVAAMAGVSARWHSCMFSSLKRFVILWSSHFTTP